MLESSGVGFQVVSGGVGLVLLASQQVRVTQSRCKGAGVASNEMDGFGFYGDLEDNRAP